jgi:hypothetical protein
MESISSLSKNLILYKVFRNDSLFYTAIGAAQHHRPRDRCLPFSGNTQASLSVLQICHRVAEIPVALAELRLLQL